MKCNYKYIILTILLFTSLPGCSVYPVVVFYDSEVQQLRDGEDQFELGNYKKAEKIFIEISKSEIKQQIKNTALYNLACTRIMIARTSSALIKAVQLFNEWKAVNQRLMYMENPDLAIAALKKQSKFIKREQAITQEKEAQIETLQHQISELEAIDLQLQEIKKPL
ncbi:MAG: hypothetical protein OCC45_10240 [Desulfotalea sp.]